MILFKHYCVSLFVSVWGVCGTVGREQDSWSKGCEFESRCCRQRVVSLGKALYLNCLSPPRCQNGKLLGRNIWSTMAALNRVYSIGGGNNCYEQRLRSPLYRAANSSAIAEDLLILMAIFCHYAKHTKSSAFAALVSCLLAKKGLSSLGTAFLKVSKG